jgi:hypothetical protein
MAKTFDIRSALIRCAIVLAVFTSAALADDLPNSQITPGLADPELTKDVICAPGFSTRVVRSVPSARKKAIYKVYEWRLMSRHAPAKSII